jgi:O-antigen ligase
MRQAFSAFMIGALVLCLVSATVLFGAATLDWAAPALCLGLALAGMWLVKLGAFRSVHWKRSPMHLPVAAFVLYTLARYFTSPIEYEARVELLQVGLYGLIYFSVALNLHRRRDRMVFLTVLAVLAVLESAYGFWQFARQDDSILHLQRPAQYHGRGSGTYVCPNHLAGFLEMVLGLLLARTALKRDRRSSMESVAITKALNVFAILIVIAGILTSFSRGGWIASFVGLGVFFLWGTWTLKAAWPRLALGASMILVLAVVGFKVLPDRLSVERTVKRDAETEAVSMDVTFGDRTYLWQATLRIIGDHPLWGTGPGSWRWFHGHYRNPEIQESPEYAHSDVLNLASDYGLVGLALVGFALVAFYRHALVLARSGQTSDERSFAVGSVLSVTMILVHSLFDFNLHMPANAMLLAAIMGFVAGMEDKEERYPFVPLKWVPRLAIGLTAALACLVSAKYLYPTVAGFHRYSQGNDHKAGIDWDTALKLYDRAMHFDPLFPQPYSASGQVYLAKARMKRPNQEADRRELLQKAIRRFQESLVRNPRQTLVLLHLAEAYEMLGDRNQALLTYQQTAALDPKCAFLHLRMGKFFERGGDEERAAAAYQECNRLHGDPIAEAFLYERDLPIK